jgi:hypothetical protein
MKRFIPRRVAILAAAGVAAIGGSTAAWLGASGASGSQPSASGSTLTVTIDGFTLDCNSNVAADASVRLFVERPDGTHLQTVIDANDCVNSGDNNQEGPYSITVPNAVPGVYQIGLVGETTTPGTFVAFGQAVTPYVTVENSGAQISASPAENSGGTSTPYAEIVSTFVYNPRWF